MRRPDQGNASGIGAQRGQRRPQQPAFPDAGVRAQQLGQPAQRPAAARQFGIQRVIAGRQHPPGAARQAAGAP
jgi:hypothetical protein